jgi:hypothetical protein
VLIKSADDKSKRLASLQYLKRLHRLDARQTEWLRVELWKPYAGFKGERHARILGKEATKKTICHAYETH